MATKMAARNRPWHVGLTGGIGSGKSTVGHMLAARGAALIDSDQIARDVTGPQGPAMEAIRSSFGADFVDTHGAMDRTKMRALAFQDPSARARLEAIVHPLVSQHTLLQAQHAAALGCPLIVFDIPLLAESQRWAQRLDAVVVVDCAIETQIERVMQRSGFTREVVEGIIASQATRSARRAIADIIIANDKACTLEQLNTEVLQTAAWFGL
jgi:dephospho-CoA kinase